MAGVTSRLVDPDFCKTVADMWVRGFTRKEMAQVLDCSESSVTAWIKDTRVKGFAKTMAVDRVQRISRKIDSEIDARLEHIAGWELDEILKVRKEYIDRPLKLSENELIDVGATTNDLAEALDRDAEFAEKLSGLLNKKKD